MIYPKLVRECDCKTDIHVVLYGEGVTEDGEPIVVLEDDFKCNYQDKAKKIWTSDKVLVEVTGICLIPGDIAPELATIPKGIVKVFGMERELILGTKARNPDGTVNFTQLEIR